MKSYQPENPPILVKHGEDDVWNLSKIGAGAGGISSFHKDWVKSVRTDTYKSWVDALENGDKAAALGFFRGLAALSEGGIPFPEENS